MSVIFFSLIIVTLAIVCVHGEYIANRFLNITKTHLDQDLRNMRDGNVRTGNTKNREFQTFIQYLVSHRKVDKNTGKASNFHTQKTYKANNILRHLTDTIKRNTTENRGSVTLKQIIQTLRKAYEQNDTMLFSDQRLMDDLMFEGIYRLMLEIGGIATNDAGYRTDDRKNRYYNLDSRAENVIRRLYNKTQRPNARNRHFHNIANGRRRKRSVDINRQNDKHDSGYLSQIEEYLEEINKLVKRKADDVNDTNIENKTDVNNSGDVLKPKLTTELETLAKKSDVKKNNDKKNDKKEDTSKSDEIKKEKATKKENSEVKINAKKAQTDNEKMSLDKGKDDDNFDKGKISTGKDTRNMNEHKKNNKLSHDTDSDDKTDLSKSNKKENNLDTDTNKVTKKEHGKLATKVKKDGSKNDQKSEETGEKKVNNVELTKKEDKTLTKAQKKQGGLKKNDQSRSLKKLSNVKNEKTSKGAKSKSEKHTKKATGAEKTNAEVTTEKPKKKLSKTVQKSKKVKLAGITTVAKPDISNIKKKHKSSIKNVKAENAKSDTDKKTGLNKKTRVKSDKEKSNTDEGDKKIKILSKMSKSKFKKADRNKNIEQPKNKNHNTKTKKKNSHEMKKSHKNRDLFKSEGPNARIIHSPHPDRYKQTYVSGGGGEKLSKGGKRFQTFKWKFENKRRYKKPRKQKTRRKSFFRNSKNFMISETHKLSKSGRKPKIRSWKVKKRVLFRKRNRHRPKLKVYNKLEYRGRKPPRNIFRKFRDGVRYRKHGKTVIQKYSRGKSHRKYRKPIIHNRRIFKIRRLNKNRHRKRHRIFIEGMRFNQQKNKPLYNHRLRMRDKLLRHKQFERRVHKEAYLQHMFDLPFWDTSFPIHTGGINIRSAEYYNKQQEKRKKRSITTNDVDSLTVDDSTPGGYETQWSRLGTWLRAIAGNVRKFFGYTDEHPTIKSRVDSRNITQEAKTNYTETTKFQTNSNDTNENSTTQFHSNDTRRTVYNISTGSSSHPANRSANETTNTTDTSTHQISFLFKLAAYKQSVPVNILSESGLLFGARQHRKRDNQSRDKRKWRRSRGMIRRRRFDYEDIYEWDAEEDLDYSDKDMDEIEKFLTNWHKNGIKIVIYLAVLVSVLFTCLCCVKTCCVMCGRYCVINCQVCYDRCLCRDPMYRRFRKFCQPFGLKLSYSEFKRMRGFVEDYARENHGVKELPRL